MQFMDYLHSQVHNLRVSKTAPSCREAWPAGGCMLLPARIMRAARILPYEKIHVDNLNTGGRFAAHAVDGGGADVVVALGPAARLCGKGDRLSVTVYRQMQAGGSLPQWRFVRCKGKRNEIGGKSNGVAGIFFDDIPAGSLDSDPGDDEVYAHARDLVAAGFRLSEPMRGVVRIEYEAADLKLHGKASELSQHLHDYAVPSADASGVLVGADGNPRGLWWVLDAEAVDLSGIVRLPPRPYGRDEWMCEGLAEEFC